MRLKLRGNSRLRAHRKNRLWKKKVFRPKRNWRRSFSATTTNKGPRVSCWPTLEWEPRWSTWLARRLDGRVFIWEEILRYCCSSSRWRLRTVLVVSFEDLGIRISLQACANVSITRTVSPMNHSLWLRHSRCYARVCKNLGPQGVIFEDQNAGVGHPIL